MKIDVECTEDAVLDGAYNTIMSSRPVIIIEIMGGFGHDNSERVRTRIAHTKNKLKEMGYDVQKIWVDDYLAIPNEKK
jgi:phage gp29-like protein